MQSNQQADETKPAPQPFPKRVVGQPSVDELRLRVEMRRRNGGAPPRGGRG